MRKTSRNTIGGSLPWGLIGMLGLILTVEKVVILHDRHLTGTVPLNWRYSRTRWIRGHSLISTSFA